ncbi:hypothetical protein [Armatimonas sp.]|uniref:hypothetical protein n=1 Tax=Armatimonas sp. TaxID=1872638 RepID=UPI00374D8B52
MIEGRFRDGLPRTTLTLPGRDGDFEVEFVVDTGFDGGLSLPEHLARTLEADEPDIRLIRLAGGHQSRCFYYEIALETEDGDSRPMEVLVLEGNPLLGNLFLEGTLLQIEVEEGGSVTAENL